MTPNEIVNKLNSYIRKGIVTYDHNQDESLLCLVWGMRQARAFGMEWKESKGRFLGGGIHESYGYTLTHNGQTFRTSNYITSLKMFLNFVEKNLQAANG